MADPNADVAGVIAPPPLIFAVPLAAALYEHTSHPIALMPRGIGWILGGAILVVGLTLFVSAVLQLRRAQTALVPYQPTTAIVQSWPYSFSRNPIYLSMALVYISVALIFNSLWPLLLLPLVLLVMQRGVIEREERYLERKFGEEYTAYKTRVRRWL